MNILIVFFALTVINVILSTIKSIVTIKSSPLVASLISAFYYAFYSIVVIYTVADFSIYWKVGITFTCNLIGVFLVKWFEEKSRKEKLWLVKMTIPAKYFDSAKKLLDEKDISCTYYQFPTFTVFDCFCSNREETQAVAQLCKAFNGKMFATENKLDR